MKIALYFLITILLVSCTSEEDPDTVPIVSPVLVKTIMVTNEDGSVETSTLTYDGIKLVKINSSNGITENYTYNGNVISKIEYVQSDVVLYRDTFEYSADGRMSTHTHVDVLDDFGTRHTYLYNTNGTTTITSYTGDATTQVTPNGSGTITFSGGEVSEIETTFSASHVYSYDNENNPFQNILGIDKISFAGAEATGIFHNITMDVSDTTDTTIGYEYDDTDFPNTARKNENGLITTTEYFYN